MNLSTVFAQLTNFGIENECNELGRNRYYKNLPNISEEYYFSN